MEQKLKELQDRKFRKSEVFDLLGLLLSKLLICAISLPLMIWGMMMAHNAESMSAPEIMGVLIVLLSGVIYFLLNVKKFVDRGLDIGEFMFRTFCPKLYKA